MVQTNKILTVSYGTFSCTLEGFDESFETMKAIAEYFRDLAADDRYFGAEPPTPDAEMLARIAEREISRRVEAHSGDDGIVLRPSLADASGLANAAAAPTGADADPAASAARETGLDETAAEETAADETGQDETGPDDSLVTETGPDRAAAAETALSETPVDTPVETPVEDPGAEMAEADTGTDIAESISARMAALGAAEDDADSAEDAADAADEDELQAAADFLSDEALGGDAADETAEDEGSAEDHKADAGEEDETSIAAKLRRIRQVVSSPDEPRAAEPAATADNAYSEDEHAENAGPDEMDDVMATLGSDAPADAGQADEAEAQAAQDPAETQPEGQDDAARGTEAESESSAQEGTKPRIAPRRPVRVVKVKRRPAGDTAAEDRPNNTPDNTPDDTPAPAARDMPKHETARDSTLSAEDEADLQRELQALEAELETGGPDTGPAEAEPDMPAPEAEAPEDALRDVRAMANRDQLESLAEDDSDMSRLLAQTDEELNEPEGRNRRNAIAHLRAAVAATRADRSSDGAGKDSAADPRNAYREDLAQAVRPRRTLSDQDAAGTPRVAPLKLVAEQRVDVDSAHDGGHDSTNDGPRDSAGDRSHAQRAAAQAVRPRRVSLRDEEESAQTQGGGFAAFAEERGASRLPDLLEAAAAYMSFVEGREKFSRPQLMNKVRQIEELDSSREDRLRSFGQLLREGKIEKVAGGRFTASDTIGFRPGARAAG